MEKPIIIDRLFYFNTDLKTYKLECFDEKPVGKIINVTKFFIASLLN